MFLAQIEPKSVSARPARGAYSASKDALLYTVGH